MDLRLDDIDAGHFFRDRMLHLNAWIDLDEIELAGIGIHEELNRASTDIIGGMRDLQAIIGQLAALRIVEIGCRRALHDLLVTALDGAVTLKKMDRIAVRIAQYLHFDMAGTLHQLFEINFILAKGRLGLALGFHHLAGKIGFSPDGAHTAAAAAPACFQHQRIADLGGKLLHLIHIIRQRIGGRHHRHANLDSEIARGDLVAEAAHGFRLRPDEDDTVFRAGFGKFRAFRQETVTWMDRIGARKLGNADDFVNGKIAFNGAKIAIQMRSATDLIAFIRLEAMQGKLVFLSPYGHRFEPQLIGGAEYANCDFRSVGDQNFRDRLWSERQGRSP